MPHRSHAALLQRQNHPIQAQQLELLRSFMPLVTHLLHELDWQELSPAQKRKLDASLRELANAAQLASAITVIR